MTSVGVDLHRKRSPIAALDEHGAELFSRRIVNDCETFLRSCSPRSMASPRSRSRRRMAESGWPSCSRTMATSCTWPIRCKPRPSPRRG
jgi:hypothetical protein